MPTARTPFPFAAATDGGGGGVSDHGALTGLGNDDHTQYVHRTSARTITAQHSFAPGAAAAPFALGVNAQGQLVTGLSADLLDGLNSSDFAAATHTHDASAITSGLLALARGGTNADLSASGGTGQVLRQSSAGAAVTVSALAQADIGGLGTSDSPQFTAVNIGHATDSTLTRSAAGKLAVEGKAIPLMSGAVDLVLAGPTAARTWTGPDADATLLYSGGALGTPSSGTLTNATGLPASALVSGIIPEATYLGLAAGLSADGKWCGITVEGTAGAALAFGDLCYLAVADSRWELTDADAAATAGGVLLGMCVLAAAGDASATRMLLFGTIRADTKFPALTIGAPVYVGVTAGEIQVAQPSGTDDVMRIVGEAVTADSIMFNPSRDFGTHV